MAQPQAYNRQYDFTERDGDDTDHSELNAELDAAARSINEIRENLGMIQRDDGGLRANVVTFEALSDEAVDEILSRSNSAVQSAITASQSALEYALSASQSASSAANAQAGAETAGDAALFNAQNAATSAASAAAAKASVDAAANAANESAEHADARATAATESAASAATSSVSAAASAASAAAAQGVVAADAASAAGSAASAGTSASQAATHAGVAATSASVAEQLLQSGAVLLAQASDHPAFIAPEIVYSASRVMIPDTTPLVEYPNAAGTGTACRVYQRPASMRAEVYNYTYADTSTRPMQTFGRVVVYGSSRVDTVYVNRYSMADCSALASLEDVIYLPGFSTEYQFIHNSLFITIKKMYADGRVEGAVVGDGTSVNARDWVVFRDGKIRTDALKVAVLAGTPPVLDASTVSPETPPNTAFIVDSGWPSNVYFADGRAISRADNPHLFALLGTRFGAGDGSTTFNLPALDPSDKSLTPHSGVAGLYAYIKS